MRCSTTLEPAVEESEELYLLTPAGDNVKVRDGLMDIKVLRETDASGLQRWEPILKAAFPLDDEAARTVFQSLRRPLPDLPSDGLSLEAVLTAAGVGAAGGPRLLRVHKQRARYTVAGCQAERTVFEVDGRRTTSIAVESTDPAAVVAAVDALGLSAYVQPWTSRRGSGCSSMGCRSAMPSSTRARTRPSSTSRSSTPTAVPGGPSSTGPS